MLAMILPRTAGAHEPLFIVASAYAANGSSVAGNNSLKIARILTCSPDEVFSA